MVEPLCHECSLNAASVYIGAKREDGGFGLCNACFKKRAMDIEKMLEELGPI